MRTHTRVELTCSTGFVCRAFDYMLYIHQRRRQEHDGGVRVQAGTAPVTNTHAVEAQTEWRSDVQRPRRVYLTREKPLIGISRPRGG